jgi:hypothetical protein
MDEELHEFDEDAHIQQMIEYHENMEDIESVSTNESALSEVVRVRELFRDNADFRKDIKKYKQASRAIAKPRKAFLDILKRKKEEYQTFLNPLLTQIRAYKREKEAEIKNCAEYKQLRVKELALNRASYKLSRLYRVRDWKLTYLSNNRGFRNIYIYRASSYHLLNRALPRRIRL